MAKLRSVSTGPRRGIRSLPAILGPAFWLAFAILALAGIVLALSLRYWTESRAYAERMTATLVTAEVLLSTLKDAETGQRGYLLTGAEWYLEPYANALPYLDDHLASLRALLAGEPADLRRLDGIESLIQRRVDQMASTIETYRAGDPAGAVAFVRTNQGKGTMDALRREISALQDSARARLIAEQQGARWSATLLSGLALVAAALASLYLAWRNIGRRRREEEARSLLDGVLANSPAGVCFLDRALRFTHVNPAIAEMNGRPVEDHIGRSIWEFVAPLRERLEPILLTVLRDGRTFSKVELEAASEAHGGGRRHYLASYFPLGAEDGAVDGVGVIVTDITDRKHGERELSRSEERFRSLVEATSAIVWTTAAGGEITTPQPSWSAFTGQSFDELKGHGWLDAVYRDDRAETAATWRTAIENRAMYVAEHRLRRHDGEYRHMAVRAVPILEARGAVREWVGLHMDITDRRRAEEELAAAKEAAEEANRAKSQFIANMSHELRTPLSAVIGYTEMLEEEAADLDDEAFVEDLGKIKSNARHLLTLINDVLDLSKIEAGKMEVHPEPFEVGPMMTELAATVEALIQKKGNSLTVEQGRDLGGMYSDQVKVRQCLLNLLSNAAKFTENGRIVLSAERERADGQDRLVFRVRDTGIGMTPDQLQRLFKRFSQADASTTRRFGGTGLGLSITKAFATMLKGEIAVESAPGQGSIFTIRLPADLRALSAPETAVEAPAETARAPVESTNLVLVIDDDPPTRDLLSRFLTRDGYVVRTAGDGEAGLRLARMLRPSAILLDVMMPRMDGWAVLSALKADPDLADIPVIMISIVHEKTLGLSLGAAEYLTKPIQWTRLKRVLARFRCPHPPCRVLVVEDDESTRAMLRQMLEKQGWTAADAANGRIALERMEVERPSLILLDLQMPEMNGFAFIQEMRKRAEWRDIPVLVVTARDITPEDRERLQGGVQQIIRKDEMTPEGLVAEVRRTVATAAPLKPETAGHRQTEGTNA